MNCYIILWLLYFSCIDLFPMMFLKVPFFFVLFLYNSLYYFHTLYNTNATESILSLEPPPLSPPPN